MRRAGAVAALAIAAVASTSCVASQPTASTPRSTATTTRASGPAARSPASPTRTSAARAGAAASAAVGTSARSPVPRHVVVVVMENHSYSQIIGNRAAPYLNRLARTGRLLTHMRAVSHPSEPNYLALFSGSTHGIRDDSCPHYFPGRNLGSQLRAAGHSFVGWAEGLPHAGSRVCVAGEYARKHAPWVNFTNLPRRINRPFTGFPRSYAKLPTVSFVVPNLLHDMHDGTIAQGDRWVRTHLSGYARWARTHDSWLIVTWDEDDGTVRNHIPTMITGAHVGTGPIARRLTLFSLLRLLERTYGLPLLGHARTAAPIPLR